MTYALQIKESAALALDMNWAHKQGKDNFSNLIEENLAKKWFCKFPMPDWYKKQRIRKIAVIRNNIMWIKKNGKLMLHVPFELRQKPIYTVHEDLLTGHDGVQKCKERLMECCFWMNMDDDILTHIKDCLKCQATKSNKFLVKNP